MPAAAPGGDSAFDPSAFERTLDRRETPRWIGWRLRGLVAAVLLACLGALLLVRALAAEPTLALTLQATPQGGLALVSGPGADYEPAVGRSLQAVRSADGRTVALDALALQRSPRWQVDDDDRARQVAQHEGLAQAWAAGPVTLLFADGSTLVARPVARGLVGIGLLFWPLAALGLALAMLGAVVFLARPQLRNALYAVMALAQAGNLLFIAAAAVRGFGLPSGLAAAETVVRIGLDLVTAAAAVHSFALHPRRLRGAPAIATAAWAVALLLLAATRADALPHLWACAQAGILALGGAALAVTSASLREEAHPTAVVLRRLGAVAVATLALVSLGSAAAVGENGFAVTVAGVGAVVWTLFLASLLLLAPFLSRSKQVLREFAMLAGISTVATSLDLLFVAVFALGQFTSLTLAVFVSLGLYAGARQWMLNQMIGSSVLTTERTFEQLYRVARELQQHPARHTALLTQLLRDLFEPLEVQRMDRTLERARVVTGGSALVVPVRDGGPPGSPRRPLALVLRFARRGQRLFTADDARLADRIVEQLRRAVAYDQAVERGRSEERLRIAQDLHDDIGARLLTLMYQAPSPEMEEYIRHTLQDLKTLTRGLAAAEHRLSHAAAEWKADLTQRLSAAQLQLGWNVDYDRDVTLSVVQWSALTRVLRELASNAIAHAGASRVDVTLLLRGPSLRLSVADDGHGREPASWSHGLGLGGVRKRVKLLGGEVRWREQPSGGTVCEVEVGEFSPKSS